MRKTNTMLVLAVLVTSVAVAGMVLADNERPTFERYAKQFGYDAASIRPGELPPVSAVPMTVKKDAERALTQLSWDDGEANSGFVGPGFAMNSVFQKFNVPPQCIQSGLSIRAVTAMVWKQGPDVPVTQFLLRQSGADPWTAGTTVAISGITGNTSFVFGQTWQTASIASGAAVIDNTNSFFAGLKASAGTVAMLMGMDTNGASNLMAWADIPFYGQQGPTWLLSYMGIRNFMLRVTVEDVNCVPVELMSFSID